MDAIVGTRFHAIILALLFRQHVVPIAYNIKTLNAMKYLGLDNVSIPLEGLKNADVNALISQSEKNKLPNLESVRRGAEKQFEKLDEFVNSHARQGGTRC
jgi:colanic acid/amylovoran biosynthesis protein